MTENNSGKMTNKDLISECFYYANGFKRHRALEIIKRNEGDPNKANYHALKQYQLFDSLELALRAVQKGVRELEDADDK